MNKNQNMMNIVSDDESVNDYNLLRVIRKYRDCFRSVPAWCDAYNTEGIVPSNLNKLVVSQIIAQHTEKARVSMHPVFTIDNCLEAKDVVVSNCSIKVGDKEMPAKCGFVAEKESVISSATVSTLLAFYTETDDTGVKSAFFR